MCIRNKFFVALITAAAATATVTTLLCLILLFFAVFFQLIRFSLSLALRFLFHIVLFCSHFLVLCLLTKIHVRRTVLSLFCCRSFGACIGPKLQQTIYTRNNGIKKTAINAVVWIIAATASAPSHISFLLLTDEYETDFMAATVVVVQFILFYSFIPIPFNIVFLSSLFGFFLLLNKRAHAHTHIIITICQ